MSKCRVCGEDADVGIVEKEDGIDVVTRYCIGCAGPALDREEYSYAYILKEKS